MGGVGTYICKPTLDLKGLCHDIGGLLLFVKFAAVGDRHAPNFSTKVDNHIDSTESAMNGVDSITFSF